MRLVDIPSDDVEAAVRDLPEDLRPRARHVITEQARVWSFADALERADLAAAGDLMRASHESLRDDFEVTGPALDALVEAAWEAPGVIGARMTGAGFGGCTVNLVHPDAVDVFMQQVGDAYHRSTGLRADFYVVSSADGAREVTS